MIVRFDPKENSESCIHYRIMYHITNGKETREPFCMKYLKKCDGKKCEPVESGEIEN